jgi:Skp family chaperone for outer membrane proteins
MIKRKYILTAALIFLISYGCTQHKVEVAPVEVKPIHITIDVNIKVDQALDDFFSDVDSAEEKIETNSTTSE